MKLSKRSFVVVAFGFALILATGASALMVGDQDFVLVNRTGYDINEVYLATPKSKVWGDDVMGADVLSNGSKVTIEFGRDATACKWDMKIVFTDEEEAVWEGFNLCEINEITLRYEGKRPTATWK